MVWMKIHQKMKEPQVQKKIRPRVPETALPEVIEWRDQDPGRER
jgi:hypothetical protein